MASDVPIQPPSPEPTQSPTPEPASRRDLARRYGPLAVVLTVLLVATVVATVRGPGELAAAGAKAAPTGRGQQVPITFGQSVKDGTFLDQEWVENCDIRTGRIRMPSVYAPPCVPRFDGDNGGSTSPGVTADTIKVVAYRAPSGGDILAALQGMTDTPEDIATTGLAYLEMLSELVETYGRRIEIIRFEGSGAADDTVAAKADAIKVAEEIKPFASIGGPVITFTYAEELAARGVVCIACAAAVPDSVAQDLAPYFWGLSPSPEQFLRTLGDYITRRLLGRKAEFAGPALRDKERVFGVVHFEQDPPVFNAIAESADEVGSTLGYESEVTETYSLDIPKLPERAAAIIAKMKASGVTSILFLGDPIMPASLTAAAAAQGYEPEWIVTGTVLTDTTAFGRTYDQSQWAHAFGLSNLAGRVPQEKQEAYRLHEWYFGEPPAAKLNSGVIYPPLFMLLLGIHLAGPNLTPATFRDGMFNYPPSGGGPTTPQISFGDHGYFADPDYFTIDDAAEIWWDADLSGPDEQGRNGTGMWSYAQRGKRYLPGKMPVAPADVFGTKDVITVFEDDLITPEDRPPDYGPRYEPPR
jgi:hypothetical protein